VNQEELTRAYQEAREKYEVEKTLDHFSLEEMQTLITYEVWADGAEFDDVGSTASMYQDVSSARHYLEQAFGY
jgi:hypothetical protein